MFSGVLFPGSRPSPKPLPGYSGSLQGREGRDSSTRPPTLSETVARRADVAPFGHLAWAWGSVRRARVERGGTGFLPVNGHRGIPLRYTGQVLDSRARPRTHAYPWVELSRGKSSTSMEDRTETVRIRSI